MILQLLFFGFLGFMVVRALTTGTMRLGGRYGGPYVVRRAEQPIRYWLSVSAFASAVVFLAYESFDRRIEDEPSTRLQGNAEATTERRLTSGPRGLTDLPPEIAAYRDSGFALYRAKQYVAAIAQFDQVIAWTRDDAQLFYWRGRGHWHLDRTDLALRDMQRAAALDSASTDVKEDLEQLTRIEARRHGGR